MVSSGEPLRWEHTATDVTPEDIVGGRILLGPFAFATDSKWLKNQKVLEHSIWAPCDRIHWTPSRYSNGPTLFGVC